MAFCNTCGGVLAENASFCGSCGARVGAGGPAGPPVDKLDYTIHGGNLQMARIRLKPGQEIYSEAGKMIYKTGNVSWDTRMSGASLGEKLLGAFRRTITGESLFLTYFHSVGEGEVGFAGSYPGKIQAIDLAPGQSILAQRDAFLLAQSQVTFNVALVKRLGAGFFGGEGFVLEKLTGPGTVFIHAGGDHVEFLLKPGETIQVESGCIVAFDESVDYDIQLAGGIKTAIFGGEGIFLANLTGPGKVIVQSMTLNRLRRELAPHGGDHKGGGAERIGFEAFSNFFGSDD